MQSAPVQAYCFKPFSDDPGISWIVTIPLSGRHIPKGCIVGASRSSRVIISPQAPAVVDDFGTLVLVDGWLS